MKKFLGLFALAFAALLVFNASPSWALWDNYLPGEAGLIGPTERQEGEIHNYTAAGNEALDIVVVEGGILGPNERAAEEPVLVADCDLPFDKFMGEAGIFEPVDRDAC